MYNDNDNALSGFLGWAAIGVAFFIGKRTGANGAYKEIADNQRDREIENLKREIAYLKRLK